MNFLITPEMNPPLPASQHAELARFINSLTDDPHLSISQRSLLRRLIDAVEEHKLRNYWLTAQELAEMLSVLWNLPADQTMKGSGINYMLDSAFTHHPAVVVGQYDVERQMDGGDVEYLFCMNWPRLADLKAEAKRLAAEAGLNASIAATPDQQQPDQLAA